MNQDNKDFELSGTLGSLNDTALDNLATQNSDVTATNNNANLNSDTTLINDSNDIEMLDLSVPDSVGTQNNDVTIMSNSLTESTTPELSASTQIENQTNLNPITADLDVGDIGSVPPIDPTGKNTTIKKKNIVFIIILIIIIIAVGALVYFYLHISKGTLDDAVKTKDLTFEIGEEIPTDIDKYATFKSISSSNCILNTDKVDVSKEGKYEYTITCGNKVYSGNLTLKDTEAPEVKTKTIVKKVNDEIHPEEFVSECNETSECNYSFENVEEVTNYLTEPGDYSVNILITDSNGNSTTEPVKLIVIDTDIKVYLNCVLPDQTIEGFNGTATYIDKIGISPESQYVGLYFKIIEYKASSEDEYNKIKDDYIKNKVLTINNGEGIPVFDDSSLTITFENPLSGASDFGNDYSSIKTHYETTKSYRCNMIKVN